MSDILDSVGAATTRCGAPATRSGILSVDEVLDLLGGCEVERIFPVDARYEERTRRAELHLWYAVRFGKEFTVDEVISRLSQLGEVQTATPNRVIKRAYREDRKAYPVSQRMLERLAVTRVSGDYAYNDVLLPWQWHIINRGYRDNFVIGDTDGKTVEEVQAKYRAGADDTLRISVDTLLLPPCVRAEFVPAVLAPGGVGELTVRFDPSAGRAPRRLPVMLRGLGLPPAQGSVTVRIAPEEELELDENKN